MGKLDEWAQQWKLKKSKIQDDAELGKKHLEKLSIIISEKLRFIEKTAINSGGTNLISSIVNILLNVLSPAN